MRFNILIIGFYVILALVCDFGLWRMVPRRKHRHRRPGNRESGGSGISSRLQARLQFGSSRGSGHRHRHRRFWRRRKYGELYWISVLFCWATLLVALAWPARDNVSIVPKIWLLFTALTVYVAKLVMLIFFLLGRLPRLWHSHKWPLGRYVGVPLGCLLFIIAWWGALYGARQVNVERVEVVSPRVPAAFNGFRIAQISDLHVGTFGSDTYLVKKLVDSVNNLHPDLIVFTGDLVNRRSDELRPFMNALRGLRAPYGVYAIMGNHDYGDYYDWESPEHKLANIDALYRFEAAMGWQLLNNGHRHLRRDNDSITILGVENWGEPPFQGNGDIGMAFANDIDRPDSMCMYGGGYKVLLSHNPEYWRREVRYISDIDLTLSGHTHAMQMQMRLGQRRYSPASLKYAAWGGLYSSEEHPGQLLYVNVGAGEVGLPFRIGAFPEVTLFTLRHSGQATLAHPLP